MTAYQAAWILPIDGPPVKDGVVSVRDGRVSSVESRSSGRIAWSEPPGLIDLGNVALLPGLVNAHTHLELSWMRGRVPPAGRFTDWVKTLFAVRGRPDGAMTAEQIAHIAPAIEELQASGTIAVGDISNSLTSAAPLRQAGLDGIVFHELLGFGERDGTLLEATRDLRAAASATGARVSLAPHAPYSTSPELLVAIRGAVAGSECPIMSVHLGESPEESELLATGMGPWREMLETIGVWRNDWPIPGCDPVSYLDRHGVLDERTLVVHGVQFDDRALARLAEVGATLVTCPRSNRWVGVGDPPIERFYRSGVRVAVGTDSLASVADLNVFSELKAMRALAPTVPAAMILESATRTGAAALGLDDLGTLSRGRRAAMISVALPAGGVDNVEEFLLSGIAPAQIAWVE